MKNLHSEILSWIGESEVPVDALHEHIREQLGESYEIGDAGMVVNEMIAEGRLEVDESNNITIIGLSKWISIY